jgi:hypothetical protein
MGRRAPESTRREPMAVYIGPARLGIVADSGAGRMWRWRGQCQDDVSSLLPFRIRCLAKPEHPSCREGLAIDSVGRRVTVATRKDSESGQKAR